MFYGWELLTKEEEDLIAKGIMKGTAYAGPFHLVLFPTNRCNFACFFCSREDRREELNWAILKKLLEEAMEMGLKGLTLAGGGEPLLYSQFNNLLNLMGEHSLKVHALTTNGATITLDQARILNQLSIRWLTVSLNETTPETHTKMCGSSPRLFDKAIEGIENGIKARAEVKSNCEVRVQIFVWKNNFRRLVEMIAAVLEAGPDYVFVNTLDELPEELRLNKAEREELKDLIGEALRRWAPILQFRLIQEGLQRFVEIEQFKYAPQVIQLEDMCHTPDRIEYCYVGWVAPLLVATGEMFPCCGLAGCKEKSVGNVYRQSLREIWFGKPMQLFRKEMRHLLLTNAEKQLLPRRPRFIAPMCLERAECPINFYLCAPEFYHRIDRWAEEGVRSSYKKHQRAKARIRALARVIKRIL